ncbi:Aminopeptidase [Aphelenchoides bicaudatus]|nr:Aminopeptidase [Aphelenchoides bicaudatus]
MFKTSPMYYYDPHVQNGLSNGSRIMNGSRVGEASEIANNRPPKSKKPSINVSRNQLLAALFLCLAAILVAILVTYTITKESMSRSNQPYINSSLSGSGSSNYNDQFDIPQKQRPHQIPELEPEAQNETDSEGTPTAKELRLSTDLFPMFYNLTVKVYVPGFIPLTADKNMTFDAALIIKFKVLNPTNKIELNSLNLHFSNKLDLYSLSTKNSKRSKRAAFNSTNDQALIVSPNGTRPVLSADVSLESDTSTSSLDAGIKVTSIALNETLEKSCKKTKNITFNIPYSGPIDRKLSGLYLTTYTDPDGKQKYAAVSQMEPTDARRFAPCFDEPVRSLNIKPL